MKKGVGSEVGSGPGARSGSTSQRYGSGDPDPHQNVMDPQHCMTPKHLLTSLLNCPADELWGDRLQLCAPEGNIDTMCASRSSYKIPHYCRLFL
jgi:hypothetical protein